MRRANEEAEVRTNMVGYVSLPLATVMGYGRKESGATSAEVRANAGFGDHLAETIAESVQRANQAGRPVRITVSERQNAAAETGSRQFEITVNPLSEDSQPATAGGTRTSERGSSSSGTRASGATASAGTATSTGTRSSTAEGSGSAPPPVVSTRPVLASDWIAPLASAKSGSVFDMQNPIPGVQDLLIKMGINPAEIKFELVDDVINNMGGSYVNHLMRVDMPNGWRENFAVEYIQRNPSITANEIAALGRRDPAPPHLRGV